MPTSMPRVGSNSSRMRLSASSHLATAIFCWLPPEKTLTRRPQRAALDFDPVEDALRPRLLRAPCRRGRNGETVDNRQRGVVLAVELRNSASVLRSSGTRPMPILARTASRGRGDRHRAAVDADLAAGELGHAEAGEEKIELAHALQAGNAEDFAARESRTTPPRVCGRPRVCARPKPRARQPAAAPARGRKGLVDRASDDHVDDLRHR